MGFRGTPGALRIVQNPQEYKPHLHQQKSPGSPLPALAKRRERLGDDAGRGGDGMNGPNWGIFITGLEWMAFSIVALIGLGVVVVIGLFFYNVIRNFVGGMVEQARKER